MGKRLTEKRFLHITRFIFVTTQIFAILWVSTSYILAAYATIKLEQPFPAEGLSEQAIITLLGNGVLKFLENAFEHNDGMIFGKSKKKTDEANTAESEGEVV